MGRRRTKIEQVPAEAELLKKRLKEGPDESRANFLLRQHAEALPALILGRLDDSHGQRLIGKWQLRTV